MAKRKNRYDGKSAADIVKGVSSNIGRITEKTLKDAVTKLSSAMNSRLSRLGKSAPESPAYREAMSSGGRFSAGKKGLEGLKQEFLRLKDFFRDPTSTVTGYKKEIAQAESLARMKGIGTPVPPPAPASFGDWEPAKSSLDGWAPPDEEWTYDAQKDEWSHPEYGPGWQPYLGDGGGLYDPVTGELAGNQDVQYHDFDATQDIRRYGKGTETGEIWKMVDSIAKMDKRFKRIEYTDPMDSPRMRLFMAIDDARVENPKIHTFEEARDWAVQHLNKIYKNDKRFTDTARSRNYSIFDKEYHEDD